MKKPFIASLFLFFDIFLFFNFSSQAANFYENDLNSETVYMVDYDSDIPIVEKNIDEKRSPASLTKIVTFIVAYENCSNKNETKFKITKEILDMLDPDSSGPKIKEGEEFSVTDLLHCMMISSSGCSAMTLAYHLGNGDILRFVDMMNNKIKEIGCTNTHFENPDGIFNENQYTTANDMYKITKYAMKNQDFLNIVQKSEYNMFNDGRDPITTTNYLIDRKRGGKYYLPYVRGIKTGYVDQAGKCLISYAVKDGKTFVAVVMGGPVKDSEGKSLSDNMAMIDTVNLYNWAFDDLKSVKLCQKYSPLTQTKLNYVWGRDNLVLSAEKDVIVFLPKNLEKSDISFEFDVPESVSAPIEKGQIIGIANAVYKGKVIASFNLISSEKFKKNYVVVAFDFMHKIFTSQIFIAILIFIFLFFLAYVLIIFRHNKLRKNKKKLVNISRYKNSK